MTSTFIKRSTRLLLRLSRAVALGSFKGALRQHRKIELARRINLQLRAPLSIWEFALRWMAFELRMYFSPLCGAMRGLMMEWHRSLDAPRATSLEVREKSRFKR